LEETVLTFIYVTRPYKTAYIIGFTARLAGCWSSGHFIAVGLHPRWPYPDSYRDRALFVNLYFYIFSQQPTGPCGRFLAERAMNSSPAAALPGSSHTMTDAFDFELKRNPEQEKQAVFSYLNRKTIFYKPLLSELIDTAYKVQANRILTDVDLEIFKKGLFESYVVVCCHYSGKFLCRLSYVDDSVQDILMKLATDANSKVRLNAITIMLYRPCDKVLNYIINAGLHDKSSTVRAKTADVIGRLDLKEYSNVLQEYIDKEEKTKVKEALEYCLYWLTHDYEIEEKTEYGYSIWVKTETGGTGVTINEAQYKQLDKTIEKIKNGTFK